MWVERPTRPPCEILRAPFDLTHGKQGIGGGGVYIRGFIVHTINHPTARQNNLFFYLTFAHSVL